MRSFRIMPKALLPKEMQLSLIKRSNSHQIFYTCLLPMMDNQLNFCASLASTCLNQLLNINVLYLIPYKKAMEKKFSSRLFIIR